jgi:SAM-dependent methyltransferase
MEPTAFMPASLVFRDRSTVHQLPWGGHFARPRPEGFRDTPSAELQAMISAVEAGRPWREVVDEAFAARKPWLHEVITSPRRTAFFGSVLPAGSGLVLDLGAGWGQICRPLARHRPVVALEPVAERLAFIRAAARQDGIGDQLTFVEADYLELSFETKFEAICAIGVLEWAGAFQVDADPQQRQREFLRKTRAELAPGGALILGIENRIGLKYLLGCADDHIGAAGIACLPAALARARWNASTGHALRSFTYSQTELYAMLETAGYTSIEFFAALPDYKLPEVLLPFEADGAAVDSWLAAHAAPEEHNGYDGSTLPPELREALQAHYRTLAEEGVAHAFVPSFFVRAS